MENFKYVGLWHDEFDIIEKDSKKYVLHGWNGEKFVRCYRMIDKYTIDESYKHHIIPIYKKDENENFDIVDYKVE